MSTNYKLISVKSSSTGTPTQVFVPEDATVAEILRKAGADSAKNDATINGQIVAGDFVPAGDSEIILAVRKYSSGASF